MGPSGAGLLLGRLKRRSVSVLIKLQSLNYGSYRPLVIFLQYARYYLRDLVGKQGRDCVSDLFVLFRSRPLEKIVVGECLQASSFTNG